MKIVIFGDIHGRTEWKKILEKESPDHVIFLGDYVSTHEDIDSQQQIDNLQEILELPDVIRLRGNHDLQHLGYYWARCSGLDNKVLEFMSNPEFKKKFLENTCWFAMLDNSSDDYQEIYLCSHAGVSQDWFDVALKYIDKNDREDPRKAIDAIDKLEPSELWAFTPDNHHDYSGTSKSQPPTWIRPQTLASHPLFFDNNPVVHQIVGHTPVTKIQDVYKAVKHNSSLWLCDRMPKEYLVLDNEGFHIGTNYKNQ